jgi:hypothetical protein
MNIEDTLSAINDDMDKREGVAMQAGSLNTCAIRAIVGPDQEVWVRNQILLAMRMALALHSEVVVRADHVTLEHGLHGIAEGAAIEIIHTLDMEPGYVNLKRR